MWLWSIYSCFQWYKNYKNRSRNARVVVENNVASFFRTRCSTVRNIPSRLYLGFSVALPWMLSPIPAITWVSVIKVTPLPRYYRGYRGSTVIPILTHIGATTLWDPWDASLPTFKDVGTKIIWSPSPTFTSGCFFLLHSAYSNERPD